MSILLGLIKGLLDVYKLLIVAYCILSVIGIPANRWTELLRSVIEPFLVPIRRFLAQKLPASWRMLDWSPVVLFLAVTILKWLL